MDHINGLPMHPLIVHIPVAMLPLAFVGVVAMIIKRAWYERYRWAVLLVAGIGTLGAILAASTGEALEADVRQRDGVAAARAIHDHAEAGALARPVAILFFIALAAWVIIPWYLERRSPNVDAEHAAPARRYNWLRPALMAVTAVMATASMITVYEAGHSGAS